MDTENIKPIVIEPPALASRTWIYPWIGVFIGVILGITVIHPLAMVVQNFHEFIYNQQPFRPQLAVLHSFTLHMWPMHLLYAISCGAIGAILGTLLRNLKKHHLRLDFLHQEFQIQVAALRHHYKNLALAIHGFCIRNKKKLTHLDKQFLQCVQQNCLLYDRFCSDYESLKRSADILEEAAQNLTHTLGQELLFLKALTTNSLTPVRIDFYPFLIRCIQELLTLRFRDKKIQVEIDGRPMEACQGALIFSFEPYSMEVILQNILSNSMNYGDLIKIKLVELDDWVRVEIKDNGPGLEVEKLKHCLLVPVERKHSESTHIGLNVTLYLLMKCSGRLLVLSKPGAGATFVIEYPKLVNSV
jgi:signal transduction histidine kinase